MSVLSWMQSTHSETLLLTRNNANKLAQALLSQTSTCARICAIFNPRAGLFRKLSVGVCLTVLVWLFCGTEQVTEQYDDYDLSRFGLQDIDVLQYAVPISEATARQLSSRKGRRKEVLKEATRTKATRKEVLKFLDEMEAFMDELDAYGLEDRIEAAVMKKEAEELAAKQAAETAAAYQIASRDFDFNELFDEIDFDHYDRQQDIKMVKGRLAVTSAQIHITAHGADITVKEGDVAFAKLKEKSARMMPQEQLSFSKRALWEATKSTLRKALADVDHTDSKATVHVEWMTGAQAKLDPIKTALEKFLGTIEIPSKDDLEHIKFTGKLWGGPLSYGPFEEDYEAWYPNFGDKNVFYAGKSWLLGQDETISLEHPMLIGLRDWLIKQNGPICPFQTEQWNDVLPPEEGSTLPRTLQCHQYIGKGSMVIKNVPRVFRVHQEYNVSNTKSKSKELTNVYGDGGGLMNLCGIEKCKDASTAGCSESAVKDKKHPDVTLDVWNELPQQFDFGGLETLVEPEAKGADLFKQRTNIYIMAHPVKLLNIYDKHPGKISKSFFQDIESVSKILEGKKFQKWSSLWLQEETRICDKLMDAVSGQHQQCQRNTCLKTRDDAEQYKKIEITSPYIKLDDRDAYLCYDDPESKRVLFHEGLWEPYTVDQIKETFSVILNTFNMIKQSYADVEKVGQKVELHVGNLGGGIFANNMNLVAMLQITAAKSVGIKHIVYHDGSDSPKMGKAQSTDAKFLNAELLQEPMRVFKECYPNDERVTLQKFFAGVPCLQTKPLFAAGVKISFS